MALKTTLLLIRHTETDLAGSFCGHSDPPLNARGLAQIPALLSSLQHHPYQQLYTSDLRRARQTADALAIESGIKYQVREGLREIFFGRWEGMRWGEIEHSDPGGAKAWLDSFPDGDFPDGEPQAAFRARVRREINAIIAGSLGSVAAIVTHAGVIRTALPDYAQMTAEEAWEKTAEYGSLACIDVQMSAIARSELKVSEQIL